MLEFCSLISGSQGNSYFLSDKNTNLLLDIGISGKQLEAKMKSIDRDIKAIDGILVSHEHSDHIKGVGIISRRYNIPIFANEKTWEAMDLKLGNIKDNNKKIFKTDSEFQIKSINIKPFKSYHDAVEPVGFSVFDNNKKISIATDIGKVDGNILNNLSGSDLVVLEANHDEDILKASSYPYYLKRRILSTSGHLSNVDCGKAMVKLLEHNIKNFVLAHLSRENNFPSLAVSTVKEELTNSNINLRDIDISLALRDSVSRLYKI